MRHADETGWSINGINGYAWLFATETISVFQFRSTRSAKVPQAVFGTQPLPGVLIVDRYAGYNKVPCFLQYCYAHLLREVEDLGKEFSDDHEMKRFVSVMASLLSAAMGLRNQPISDKVYYNRAAELKTQLQVAVESSAQHLGFVVFRISFMNRLTDYITGFQIEEYLQKTISQSVISGPLSLHARSALVPSLTLELIPEEFSCLCCIHLRHRCRMSLDISNTCLIR